MVLPSNDIFTDFLQPELLLKQSEILFSHDGSDA